MNKENQILLIEKFLISNEETIIINQVNDELRVFYVNIIKYFAEKKGFKIKIDNNNEIIETVNDLFGLKEIKIFNITNTKKLTSVLNLNGKKVIFTDYKNFKNLITKYVCVNGYKFEQDLNFFIRDELNINNDELIHFCKNNPALINSETSKYLINNKYSKDQAMVEEKNHIINIRKSVFEMKRNNFNIKDLYLSIKSEAEYKKLSFLIY